MRTKVLPVLFAIGMFAFANSASAATVYVDSAVVGGNNDGTTLVDAFLTIEAGVTAAVDGLDTVEIHGLFTNTTEITVNKSITLKGVGSPTINTSGGNYVFRIVAPSVTIQDLILTKTDATGQNMIGIQADHATIKNNAFSGQYNLGDGGAASRGFEVSAVTGFLIDSNTFNHLRQPGYINVATGVVSNNTVDNSKGFVIVSDSNVNFIGNTFGTNIGDIAIICSPSVADNATCPNTNNYTDTVALSAANNGAVVDKQVPVKDNSTLSVVYVDGNLVTTGNGTEATPYKTIAEALVKVAVGGTIIVKSATYTENITINKAITLRGANSGIGGTAPRGAESILIGKILVTASSVTVDGFEVTNPTYSGGSTIHGIQIFGNGPTITNINIKNNVVSVVHNQSIAIKGAYGIMVQADVSIVTIDNNKIEDITTAGWARGIEVTPSCGVVGIPQSVTITNNSISNIVDSAGTDAYVLSIDWCSSVPRIANAAQVLVEENTFDSTKVKNVDTTNPLVITKNYWGSDAPDFSGASGTFTTDPWYIDAGLTTLYSVPVPPTPTPSGGGGSIVIPSSAYSYSGTTPPVGSTAPGTTPIVNLNGGKVEGQVLGAATFSFRKNLGYGSRGEEVSELQKILIAGQYLKLKTGLPTGWFGPLTRAALAGWQKVNNVTPTNGYFGELSRKALN